MYFWLSTLKPNYDFTTVSFPVIGQCMEQTLEVKNYLRKKKCDFFLQLNF